MNKHLFLVFALLLILSSAIFNFGCGKYIASSMPPTVIDSYPARNSTGIGSAETLWVKFSKSMDSSNTSFSTFGNKFVFAPDSTATSTMFADVTPEVYWTDSDTKLVITNIFFIASPGDRVHVTASKEGFMDTNGQKLTEGITLWEYTLSGVSVISRSPTIDAMVTNSSMTIEVTFNNPIVTGSLSSGWGSSHTAGLSIPYPPGMYWTNGDKTLNIEIGSWTTTPSVVDITAEVYDIYGNHSGNTQLFKYNVL